MRRIKVYDADGKHVESYDKAVGKYMAYRVGEVITNWTQQVQFLNTQGYWVKGQVTSKGVKIK